MNDSRDILRQPSGRPMPETRRQWLDRFSDCLREHRPDLAIRDILEIAADAYEAGAEIGPEQVALFVASHPLATLRNRRRRFGARR